MMMTIQGQYAACRVMIDEIDADTRRLQPHAAHPQRHLPAVDLHEVLPEIYNLKGS